nr:hypothetical protein [Tanacetum cinerariifolium]
LFDQDFFEAVSFLLSGGEFDVPWGDDPGLYCQISEWVPIGLSWRMASFCVVPPPNYLVVCRTCVPVFTNYTVLGDDVVIVDENVATRYKESLDLLRVVISKEKSLISRSGSAEFANSFRVRDLTVDRSSVSIKALLNTFHPGLMAVAHRYSVCDLLCRLGGARYHVLARLDHRRPEAHGHLVRLLRAKLKPRELPIYIDRHRLRAFSASMLLAMARSEMSVLKDKPQPYSDSYWGNQSSAFDTPRIDSLPTEREMLASILSHRAVKRLQAHLRDLKGKSSDNSSASNTLDPLNQKLESKIVELEFQVVNYKREIGHLKTTYKNLFDSITSNQAHAKLHNLIYENAKLRAWLFENTSEPMNNTSGTSVTPQSSAFDTPRIDSLPTEREMLASILSHRAAPCSHPDGFLHYKVKSKIQSFASYTLEIHELILPYVEAFEDQKEDP